MAGLTDQQSEWLGNATEQTAAGSVKAVDVDDELVVLACDIGSRFGTASEADLEGLRESVAPVYDRMREDPALAELLADIEDLKRGTPAEALAIPEGCTGASPLSEPGTASDQATPIDGTWEASFTRDELLAAGILDAGEDNNGNWGDMVVTLDRGSLDWDVANEVQSDSYSAEYEVEGDVMHLRFPGEELACRWSIFRDTLTFTRDQSLGICPTPLIVEPWTRRAS